MLSHGGSREQTLPTKNNPNPDLTDVGSLLNAEKLRNSNLTVQQLKQLKNAALMIDTNGETDAEEIDIEAFSDTERLVYDYLYRSNKKIKPPYFGRFFSLFLINFRTYRIPLDNTIR